MIRDNRRELEKSYFLPLQECLLRRYYEIEKKSEGKGKAKEEVFSEEALSQLSVYLSWLETLPSSSLPSLLQSLQQDKLLNIATSKMHKPSATHKRLSDRLRVAWRERIEKEVAAGKISEEFKEKVMNVKIVDEYIGLSRKVFPMDIAVVQDVVGGVSGGKEEKVLLFIEIDGDYHKHTVKEGALKIFDTKDQLKEYLYGEKYKGVGIERFDVRVVGEHTKEMLEYLVAKVWKLVE